MKKWPVSVEMNEFAFGRARYDMSANCSVPVIDFEKQSERLKGKERK